MTKIVLSTLNARYPHASLGLRCLRANLGELRADSCLLEFVVGQKTEEMAERILALSPRVLGLGVYIWNVEESTRLVAQLKRLAPQLWIVLGGPEVSHEVDQQRICALADYVVTGWGDISFARLLRDLLAGRPPANRIVVGEQPPLAALALPYAEYTEEDIAKRYIYVEASRGCPFKCEFCLSALDRSAWAFPLAAFFDELATLWARGAREFKFVDRTFNLKIDASLAIIEFFLQRGHQIECHLTGSLVSFLDRLAAIANFSRMETPISIQGQMSRQKQQVTRPLDRLVIGGRCWCWG